MRREVAAAVILNYSSGVVALHDAFGPFVFYRRGDRWGRGGSAVLVGSDFVAANGGAATVVVVIVGVVVGPVAHIGAGLAVDRFGHPLGGERCARKATREGEVGGVERG